LLLGDKGWEVLILKPRAHRIDTMSHEKALGCRKLADLCRWCAYFGGAGVRSHAGKEMTTCDKKTDSGPLSKLKNSIASSNCPSRYRSRVRGWL
jgi:hypothetical protein